MEINLLHEKFVFGKLENFEGTYSGTGSRFLTDNVQLDIVIRLKANCVVPQHVGCSLVNGFYYAIVDVISGRILWHDVVALEGIEKEIALFRNNNHKELMCEIFFPILNEIDYLILKTEKEILNIQNGEKIFFWGGPLTYGIGVTAANFMFSNIITRRLKLDGYNFARQLNDFFDTSKMDISRMLNILKDSKPAYFISELGGKGMKIDQIENELYNFLMVLATFEGTHFFFLEEDSFYMTEEKCKRKKRTRELLKYFNSNKKFQIINMDDVFQNGSNDRYFYSSNFYNDYANGSL